MQLHITCVQATDQILRTTGSRLIRRARMQKKGGKRKGKTSMEDIHLTSDPPYSPRLYDTPFQGITNSFDLCAIHMVQTTLGTNRESKAGIYCLLKVNRCPYPYTTWGWVRASTVAIDIHKLHWLAQWQWLRARMRHTFLAPTHPTWSFEESVSEASSFFCVLAS